MEVCFRDSALLVIRVLVPARVTVTSGGRSLAGGALGRYDASCSLALSFVLSGPGAGGQQTSR